MLNWNPQQYLKFAGERTQPSIDLAARIAVDNPTHVIDIGCGPGNSTQVLTKRWPAAKVLGLDSSAEMISKASKDYPELEWVTADASEYEFRRKYDVVFSNAALQWIPDQEHVIVKLLSAVSEGGVLAVQVPADVNSHLRKAVIATAAERRWSALAEGAENVIVYHDVDFYYDLVSTTAIRLDIWETIYYHVLDSHRDLVEWYKGTGMRPFLERLPDDASRDEFEEEVLRKISGVYKISGNGKLLYPFRRIFFVAYK